MVKKLPIAIILTIGWILTALFAYGAFVIENSRLSNLASDAFGTALSIVLLLTITVMVLKFKKII